MMRIEFSFSLLVFLLALSYGEGRKQQQLNIALLSNLNHKSKPICAMVDDVTLKKLNADPEKEETYSFSSILTQDGCQPLPTTADVKGKFVAELSNYCSVHTQMAFAMEAGAAGLMIVVRNNISHYPFQLNIGPTGNRTIPVMVLLEAMYSRFMNVSRGERNVTMSLKGLPQLPKMLMSFFFFVVIAVVCLVLGMWLSVNGLNGLKYSPIFGAPQTRSASEEPLTGVVPAESFPMGSTDADRTPNQTTQQCKAFSGVISIVVLLAFASMMLLLLYFFYDVFVWILITVICLIFAISLKSLLMEIICRLPMQGSLSEPIMVNGKIARSFLGPEFDKRSLIIFPFCLIPSILWLVYRKNFDVVWIIQDIMGIVACSHIIKTVRFGSLKYITIFCVLFFAYDIFMVYITPLFKRAAALPEPISHFESPLWSNKSTLTRVKRSSGGGSVMEDVATGAAGKSGEKLPILFILPYFDWAFREVRIPCTVRQFSMLGFGDIIVPGILVAYSFYCDTRFHNAARRCCRYLYSPIVIIGYVLGLLFVFIILVVMRTGQPALLTLIPCTLAPFLVTSAITGDFMAVWNGQLPDNSGGLADAEEFVEPDDVGPEVEPSVQARGGDER